MWRGVTPRCTPPRRGGVATRGGAPERGFTIMELLIGLTMAGLVGSLLFAVWTFTLSFTRRGGTEVEAQQMGRIAMVTLTRELREALADSNAVAVWSTADGGPVDAIGFVSAREGVAGRPFGIDASGNPTWQTAVYYVHDRTGGTLRRLARPWEGTLAFPPTGEGRVVARGTRLARFTRQGDLVTITLLVAAGRREITLQTSVLPRN